MNTEPQNPGLSLSVKGAGNSDWFGNVLAPLQEELSKVIPRHLGEIPEPLRQRMTRSDSLVVNAGWEMILTACVTFFIAKQAGRYFEKTLDVGFEIILKPHIRKMWQGLNQVLTSANQKKKKALVVSVWYEESKVLVTVAIVGKTFDDIIEQLDHIHQVHLNAQTWIANHGVSAPVHHYMLQDGKFNVEPVLLEHEGEALKRLHLKMP